MKGHVSNTSCHNFSDPDWIILVISQNSLSILKMFRTTRKSVVPLWKYIEVVHSQSEIDIGIISSRHFENICLEHDVSISWKARHTNYTRIVTTNVVVQKSRYNILKFQSQLNKHQKTILCSNPKESAINIFHVIKSYFVRHHECDSFWIFNIDAKWMKKCL